MNSRLNHELLLSRLRTKDRAVKNITSICIVWVLTAAISSTVIAQRTSSAVQTVTFGVRRTSQSVLRNVSLVQSTNHLSDGSQGSTLQNVASTHPMKVTVNALSIPAVNDGTVTEVHSSPRLSALKTVGSGSVPSTSEIQPDAGLSYFRMALVVTITE
jgi:hypothetical protein